MALDSAPYRRRELDFHTRGMGSTSPYLIINYGQVYINMKVFAMVVLLYVYIYTICIVPIL